jgi:hypothetical protein
MLYCKFPKVFDIYQHTPFYQGENMKKKICSAIILCLILLLSCSVQHQVNYEFSGETGGIELSLYMGKVGALEKTTSIEMTKLYIALSASGQYTVYDTFQLSGGNYERTIGKTYSGLVATIDGQSTEWTLSVTARDQNNRTIYFGDTSFIIQPVDTIDISLYLSARYSMLVANYYPIRDSVTRCVLWIDGDSIANSSFPKQTLIGHTVSLSYDYLTASPTGISHHIDMNVFGVMAGTEMLLFSGDTTITVFSGEDKTYDVVLGYSGPITTTLVGGITMIVTLGNVGTSTINGQISGIMDSLPRYTLTMTKVGNGTVTPWPSETVIQGISYPITATPSTGYNFGGWQVISGSATIANPLSTSTTVILKSGNATIRAIFITGSFGGT